MFTKAKNIDTTFRQLRLFCLLVIVGCILLTGYTIFKAFSLDAYRKQTVLVLPSGKVIEAFAIDRKENIPVELRDHVRTFHQHFFNLGPDEKVIKESITKALYLADGSAKTVYDNLKESNYYVNLVAGNVNQKIRIDSVQVDVNQYPYYFRFYGTQNIVRPTSIVERTLTTEGWIRSLSQQSDNNPHGFLIERWKIIDNQDISIKNR